MASDPPATPRPAAGLTQGRSGPEAARREALARKLKRKAGPGTRFFRVVARVVGGTWDDGFIHAGNLAYMSLLSLFPFFIALAAIFSVLGEQDQMGASIDAILRALPPRVGDVLRPVAHDVAAARHGYLLWIGGFLGVWTAGSLIETIRDILHRAYDVKKRQRFWRSRLVSSAVIFGSVLLLLVSLSSQVLISTAETVLATLFPRLDNMAEQMALTTAMSAAGIFVSIYMLFYLLTPHPYQHRRYLKWPGPAFVTLWWLLVAWALPKVLQSFLMYDLTYGSLAGVMIALFFFWLVGLGMVVGAELNAALAGTPDTPGPATTPGSNDKESTGRNE